MKFFRILFLFCSIFSSVPQHKLDAQPSIMSNISHLATNTLIPGWLPRYLMTTATHFYLGTWFGGTVAHELGHGCTGLILDGVPFKLCLGNFYADSIIDNKYIKITKGINLLSGLEGATDSPRPLSNTFFKIAKNIAGPICGIAMCSYMLSKMMQEDWTALELAESISMKTFVACLAMLKTYAGVDAITHHAFNLLPTPTKSSDGDHILRDLKIPDITVEQVRQRCESFANKAVIGIPLGAALLQAIQMAQNIYTGS